MGRFPDEFEEFEENNNLYPNLFPGVVSRPMFHDTAHCHSIPTVEELEEQWRMV